MYNVQVLSNDFQSLTYTKIFDFIAPIYYIY